MPPGCLTTLMYMTNTMVQQRLKDTGGSLVSTLAISDTEKTTDCKNNFAFRIVTQPFIAANLRNIPYYVHIVQRSLVTLRYVKIQVELMI